MRHRHVGRWLAVAALTAVTLLVAGCGGGETHTVAEPATLEEVAGTDLSRITLTAEAVKRLDIHTRAVERLPGTTRTVIPYSAVLYSNTGETWAYVSPKALTFVRQRIVVDTIDGDRAVLSSGPAPGTIVATVGVAELHGTESGLGSTGH